MPQPEQPHTILLVHCHYRLPGGEDAVFAAECAMLQAHGHRVITYERPCGPSTAPKPCGKCAP